MTADGTPEPSAEQLTSPGGTPLTALCWADARTRLSDSGDYLLATSTASGRVHVVPILGVWLDGAVCFASGRRTRKVRDLAENGTCAITVPGHDVDIVVEGTAHLVRDTARLHRIADLFPAKYPWWHPFVGEGGFHDPADTALSDPQHVFAVTPAVVFAFGKENGFTATRWRFLDQQRKEPLPWRP
ncbi:pyridoxamine 5'-phosphate oxidase family protein [Amycolatopsis minnesotensis]|uniref:Pyridoxamine 5'-phosphate oxidase family protein n=1 Tax=Amycolatopsis minnesotensis TaxID=337894 RepID=A0ABN2QKJ9_9PSEU